ncbi:hypothetical protein COW81_02135 [Candidatus Campbellbacteria bacterium CG22_combo_CG10-13_8_21_14_all_36_13]|uniref:Lipid II flippase MurJ n=1 Tax=Candidatus Campbellbacteria bacterium CG22_combo_CG10-13_8_21_14_all_36_13 TaxID=1974529 RepID=A0A2H0DY14_9BACT|nr:MAG: hypothetical protein COW81_02135 [Candidatus Campbellbacteria bacterium CG22_combo_CG10-13_8_21_14_all_36_13]
MIARKIFSFINKETGGLHKAAYVLALFTLISQILGLVRDRLLAHSFGAGETLDLYYAAFRLPDLILIIAGSIVSISVIVPILIQQMNIGYEKSKKFIDSIFTFFLISIVAVCIIAFFVSPYILKILFPGFVGLESFSDLVLLTRVFLLSPLLLGISSLFAGIVQAYKRFFVYAMAPILYNVGIIMGITLLYPMLGILGLGVGVVFGAFLHMFIQSFAVSEKKMLPKITTSIDWKSVKNVILPSIPRSFTLSITSIVILFLLGFASLLREGTITIFNLAFNLQSVPLGIIGVSYSLAAFPMLSELFVKGEKNEFIEKIEAAARHIVFWSLPVLTLFIVLRAQIVRTILGSGEFTWSATRLTAATVAIFSISVFAQSLILLFVRGYYATGDTKKPLIFAVISGSTTVVLAMMLLAFDTTVQPLLFFIESLLKVEGIYGSNMLFLPLSFSIGTILNMILISRYFFKDFGKFSYGFWVSARQSLYTSIIVGFATYKALGIFDDLFDIRTVIGIFSQGLFAGLFGIVFGVLLLILLRNTEVIEVIGAFRKKYTKPAIFLPEQSEL